MVELKKEVADKYTLKKGVEATTIITPAPQRLKVNLPNLTLKEADKLVADGFPYLILKGGKEAPSADTDSTLPTEKPIRKEVKLEEVKSDPKKETKSK